jgi:hypothetical protein
LKISNELIFVENLAISIVLTVANLFLQFFILSNDRSKPKELVKNYKGKIIYFSGWHQPGGSQ